MRSAARVGARQQIRTPHRRCLNLPADTKQQSRCRACKAHLCLGHHLSHHVCLDAPQHEGAQHSMQPRQLVLVKGHVGPSTGCRRGTTRATTSLQEGQLQQHMSSEQHINLGPAGACQATCWACIGRRCCATRAASSLRMGKLNTVEFDVQL